MSDHGSCPKGGGNVFESIVLFYQGYGGETGKFETGEARWKRNFEWMRVDKVP
jgi:hypothetical protein